ncbi:MAG: DNA mismatch endonuclease Vsr [Opitutae bacterium]|nr:DNA mismatch endonuclease Vsr [Opitutae bacterium]
MADKVPPAVRSRIMSRVKSKGMKPEMRVRRILHGLGYRYRLHRSDLPGRPDIVFPSRRKIVFVNGCFWHSHSGCQRVRIPATNRGYWIEKLNRNSARDERNLASLKGMGWKVMTVWECELRDIATITEQLCEFLGSRRHETNKTGDRPRFETLRTKCSI